MRKSEALKNAKTPEKSEVLGRVPGTGLEPVRLLRSQDFKSCVSTNSNTQAWNKEF